MFNIFGLNKVPGTGALRDPLDARDFRYEGIAAAGEPVDWNKGFDIEKELDIVIPFKDQDGSGSCVGQAWAYYGAILNAVEIGHYSEQSAKAIYSQIQLGLPQGGAYIRDGAKLFVDWGSVKETTVPSYDGVNPPKEAFMKEKLWKTPEIDEMAKVFQAKEYRTFNAAKNIELFAQAIRDNYGVVGGLEGTNNGTWKSGEPKPPADKADWGHSIFFGKLGIDELGKWVASPNNWGTRIKDRLHPDGWQKLREDWFASPYMFNPWTLVDKPNEVIVSEGATTIINKYEKKFIVEGEGVGRKGIIINGQLHEVAKDREASASIYVQNNNGSGVTVSTDLFNEIPKGINF